MLHGAIIVLRHLRTFVVFVLVCGDTAVRAYNRIFHNFFIYFVFLCAFFVVVVSVYLLSTSNGKLSFTATQKHKFKSHSCRSQALSLC